MKFCFPLLFFLCLFLPLHAQHLSVSGTVTATAKPLAHADVLLNGGTRITRTDASGHYEFSGLASGSYTLTVHALGYKSVTRELLLEKQPLVLNIELSLLEGKLKEVTVKTEKEKTFGITRLNAVEGTAIYEGKKTEVVVMEDITANLATNNSRQIFAKVAGLNIWESDGAGLQLGIGGRGLDPNRTSNFNTRQNGYDISADALGYPESYYTPPTEALERIEVVRGAASLQYGTQLGGMLNFVMKRGPEDKALQLTARQTLGSFGLSNTFVSLGGTKNKVNYYTYYQYKRGDGWRPNSGFDAHTAFTSVQLKATQKLQLGFDYTFMHYLAQQPGGLTDRQFGQNPRQSVRERNWFQVDWNLLALTLDYRFSDNTRLNIRNFGLLAQRDALGNLERITRTDSDTMRRNLLKDHFRNFGTEARLIRHYNLFGQLTTALAGVRYYQGYTEQQQGYGSRGRQADFRYLPHQQLALQYEYPSRNVAVFAENIFNLNPRLSITPGFRYEYIRTSSDGYYQRIFQNLAGDVLHQETVPESRTNRRSIFLAGGGLSYKHTENVEVYANYSMNYRAINFNDMRVANSNIRVDQNLQDERGSNADLGIRGNLSEIFNFDLSLFRLSYENRIGLQPAKDTLTFVAYLLRTNIGHSRNMGVETFAELDVLKLLKGKNFGHSLSLFSNLTLVNTRYRTEGTDLEKTINGNRVELAPAIMLKSGISYRYRNLKLSGQYSYTEDQFTEATNAVFDPNATFGLIPAYHVADLSASYTYRFLTLETGVNNLTNNYYFTRRATGYPGPGIIPSDGRNFYVTLQVKL